MVDERTAQIEQPAQYPGVEIDELQPRLDAGSTQQATNSVDLDWL